MKIGILTFHHVDNYGATLQAFALWSFLNSQGYDVEIIDYRPLKAIWIYSKGLIPIKRETSSLNEGKKLGINEKMFVNIARAWNMRQFLLSHMKLSRKKIYRKKALQYYSDKYDVVICGSDQIWCFDSFRGFNPSFFLDFVNNKTTRKISYAASFGSSKELGNYQKEIHNLISQFQTILVRDTNSLNIISQGCDRQATKVLDPTCLINYDSIKEIPKIKEKYLLLYIHEGLKPEEEEFIELLAESQNLTIVSIGMSHRIAKINLESASPKEWVGAYSQASYIVTNTFHGTVFAILFQKPFNVFVLSGKSNKVVDLLQDFGLENRIFTPHLKTQILNKEIIDIDYESVSKVLEQKITESKKYLIEAISQAGVDSNRNAELNKK